MRSASKKKNSQTTSPKNDAIHSRCIAIDLRIVKADAQPSTLEEQTVMSNYRITWINSTVLLKECLEGTKSISTNTIYCSDLGFVVFVLALH